MCSSPHQFKLEIVSRYYKEGNVVGSLMIVRHTSFVYAFVRWTALHFDREGLSLKLHTYIGIYNVILHGEQFGILSVFEMCCIL